MTTILITGSNRGLGKCLVKSLNNYKVIPHSRIEGCTEPCLIGDVSSKYILSNLDKLLSYTGIDVFINNAGVYTNNPFCSDSLIKMDEQIDANFKGPLAITKKIYDHMKSKGFGLIVNISSISCLSPSVGEHLYSATKKAFDQALKCIQLEAIGTGVYFLDIYLGAMKTDMTKDRKNFDKLMNPEEVADTISRLINDFINGKTHYVNQIVIRKR